MFGYLTSKLAISPELQARFKSPQKIYENYQQISIDTFEVMSDWYHFAILELCTTENFRAEPQWIANRLGITTSQVSLAIERMKRLELVVENPDGTWKVGNNTNSTTNNEVTSSAKIKLQKQYLELALKAMDEAPLSFRSQFGMTMSLNLEDMTELKSMIKAFTHKISDRTEETAKRDHVYQLVVSLFPISKIDFKNFKEIK